MGLSRNLAGAVKYHMCSNSVQKAYPGGLSTGKLSKGEQTTDKTLQKMDKQEGSGDLIDILLVDYKGILRGTAHDQMLAVNFPDI